jgi:hypothetical protein
LILLRKYSTGLRTADDIRKLCATLLIRACCIPTHPDEAGTLATEFLTKDICGDSQTCLFYSLQAWLDEGFLKSSP